MFIDWIKDNTPQQFWLKDEPTAANWIAYHCAAELPLLFLRMPWLIYRSAQQASSARKFDSNQMSDRFGQHTYPLHPKRTLAEALVDNRKEPECFYDLLSFFHMSKVGSQATMLHRLFGFLWLKETDLPELSEFLKKQNLKSDDHLNLTRKAEAFFSHTHWDHEQNIVTALSRIRPDIKTTKTKTFDQFKTWFLLQGKIEYPKLFAEMPVRFFDDIKNARPADSLQQLIEESPVATTIQTFIQDFSNLNKNPKLAKDWLYWSLVHANSSGYFLNHHEILSLLNTTSNNSTLLAEIFSSVEQGNTANWYETEGFDSIRAKLEPHFRYLNLFVKSLNEGNELKLSELFDFHPEIITVDTHLQPGVTVIGYAQNELDLGEDARTTYFSLKSLSATGEAGLISIQPPGHPMPSPHINLESELSKRLRHQIRLFCLPLPDYCTQKTLEGALMAPGFHSIALSPWEFGTWPKSHNYYFEGLNEVWAPTEFVRQAYIGATDIPVFKMPLVVEVPTPEPVLRSEFGLHEDDFIFMYFFDFNSTVARKNPWALVKAFKQAFPKEPRAKLVIKTIYKGTYSAEGKQLQDLINGDDRILIVDQIMSRERLTGFMSIADAYVSLHRSEGFGRTLAEAMLLKIPVIATEYSGVTDFFGASFGFPVGYDIVEATPADYKIVGDSLVWAEPHVAHAAHLMRELYDGKLPTEAVTANAYKNISENFSRTSSGRKYFDRIQEILNRKN